MSSPLSHNEPSANQLRIAYSLLKPAVRVAARFGIPVRTLGELAKLAYFEHLRRGRDMSHAAVAQRMGQTERSMRSLEQKLRSDFFAAESQIGLLRAVEDVLAQGPHSQAQLERALDGWQPEELSAALEQLLREERVEHDDRGRYTLSGRYVTLTSRTFPQRIDALNHHLDGLYRAIVQRLLEDRRARTMIKTISFRGRPGDVEQLAERLETWLREEVARVERSGGAEGEARFVLGVHLAEGAAPEGE